MAPAKRDAMTTAGVAVTNATHRASNANLLVVPRMIVRRVIHVWVPSVANRVKPTVNAMPVIPVSTACVSLLAKVLTNAAMDSGVPPVFVFLAQELAVKTAIAVEDSNVQPTPNVLPVVLPIAIV